MSRREISRPHVCLTDVACSPVLSLGWLRPQRSDQSLATEHSRHLLPEGLAISLYMENQFWNNKGLILKLKLQYFCHLMRRADSLEKPLMLGKTGGGEESDRGWDGWLASPSQWTWVWAKSGKWWRTGKPGALPSMGSPTVRQDWVTDQEINPTYSFPTSRGNAFACPLESRWKKF